MTTTTQATTAEKPKTGVKKKKQQQVKEVPFGKAFILASYNNTIVTVTDQNGNTLGWCSAGIAGFKGPKKATPYAASMIVKKIAEKIEPYKVKELMVYIKGIGGGREGAIRALNANGFTINSITDTTPIPHNGCRPKPRRRV